jgi:hypothetical protein
MPPIRNKNSYNSAEQEGQILLAISDLQNKKISNIKRATKIYKVPQTTLRDQLKGTQ